VFGAHVTIVKGNTAVGSGHAGFALVGADVTSNTLTGNVARAKTVNGFLLTDGAHGNTLVGNKAESNGDGDGDGTDYTDAGFLVWDGNANALTGNTATDNDGPGFYTMGSHNTLDANTATGNFMWGFMVYGNGVPGYTSGNVLRKNVATENNDGFLVWDGATATVLDRNIANNNTVTGFAAWNVSGNTWTRNTAKGNATYGFILATWGAFCSGNMLDGNVGAGNGVLDAYDMNPVGQNVWTSNQFGTSSPPTL
jgi:parallel beta-helix repeat protein